MNIEEAIKNCEIYLKQIKQYNPDPYYVNYFFNKYIDSVNDTFAGIFEEGNRDFGLFVSENISQKKFDEKAKINALNSAESLIIQELLQNDMAKIKEDMAQLKRTWPGK